MGKLDMALDFTRQAIAKNPQTAEFYNTLGLVHEGLGEFDEAIRAYQEAISLRPDYAEAYHNMAIAFLSQGQYATVVEKCKHAIALKPDYAEPYNTMGFSLEQQKHYAEAAQSYQKAIQLKPDYVEAYNHLGVVLNELGRPDKAIENYRKALYLDPDYTEVYNNLGIALKEQDQFAEAIACFEQALQREPDFAEAHYNLANSLRDEGRCDEALERYNQALGFKPGYPEALWNKSLTLLLSGNFIEGWEQYRLQRNADLKILTNYHRSGKPRWDGTPFEGKTLLVHYEQGLGDNIQFVRYMPMIKARGGKVVFETLKPLMTLLDGFPGVDELVEYRPNEPCSVKFDVYSSLFDMPNIFRTTVETVPADVPYIHADPVKVQYWRDKLAGPGFKIGIVWAGSPTHGHDRYRSCTLASFAPIAQIDPVRLYALQKGEAIKQIDELAGTIPIERISGEFEDLSDTAAAIENLDLVISVDTSVLHLAGAMGKTAWGLLAFSPEWRWMLHRQDSPWYPTMRLFRQQERTGWPPVFRRVAEELRKTVEGYK
ncbi:MAG: tetratricopeptide repeat protein [Sedimentisphaerales bacterium]|nr:tetratricopeptide repeat protein [Sedimentisphaerales bacterium]